LLLVLATKEYSNYR